MTLVVVMSEDSLRLVYTSGEVDYQRRAVAVRKDEEAAKPSVIVVSESYEECRVNILVQHKDAETCELFMEVYRPDGEIFKDSVEVVLNDKECLPLETSYVREDKVSFTDVEPGEYRIEVIHSGRTIAAVSLKLDTER